MVKLNKIYTKTGDAGTTALGNGERRLKSDLRIEAFGTVDETNACLGIVRLETTKTPALKELDVMLARIQNELFDLGADLATPDTGKDLGYEPLRMINTQVERIESEIDALNADLEPLKSFVLPGGAPAAAGLHLARTVARRAERLMVALAQTGSNEVSEAAVKYINRLSDFFFVASRYVNDKAEGDVLWVPGKTR